MGNMDSILVRQLAVLFFCGNKEGPYQHYSEITKYQHCTEGLFYA